MEQLLACTLQEVADGSLGNAILDVRIHATKGKLLSCIMTCLLEGVVMELPVVAVVVETAYCLKASLAGSVSANKSLSCR